MLMSMWGDQVIGVHSGVNKVCVYSYMLMSMSGNQVIGVHSGVNKVCV